MHRKLCPPWIFTSHRGAFCVCAQAEPLRRGSAASLGVAGSPQRKAEVLVISVNDTSYSGFLYFFSQRSGEWFGGPASLHSH